MQPGTWIYAVVVLWASSGDPTTAPDRQTGTLEGMVVNGSRADVPVTQADVVLRVLRGGHSAVVASTRTDRYGTFRFDDLPLGNEWLYLPGASHGVVHHPGARVQLTQERPRAEVRIAVYEEVAAQSPLVIAKHEIAIRPDAGLLQVRELLVVENASSMCYIGQVDRASSKPVTLRLSIPGGCERVTFDKEFFGRRFSLEDGQLVTTIPWPPGRREIGFHYAVRATSRRVEWSRRLDLPCSRLQVTVTTADTKRVSSNLQLVRRGTGEVILENASPIPRGHVVQLELLARSVPLSVYGRWLSLAMLLALVGAACTVLVVRNSRKSYPRRPEEPARVRT